MQRSDTTVLTTPSAPRRVDPKHTILGAPRRIDLKHTILGRRKNYKDDSINLDSAEIMRTSNSQRRHNTLTYFAKFSPLLRRQKKCMTSADQSDKNTDTGLCITPARNNKRLQNRESLRLCIDRSFIRIPNTCPKTIVSDDLCTVVCCDRVKSNPNLHNPDI